MTRHHALHPVGTGPCACLSGTLCLSVRAPCLSVRAATGGGLYQVIDRMKHLRWIIKHKYNRMQAKTPR